MNKWRDPVDGTVNFELRPDSRPEDIAQAREHLTALLGRVGLVSEDRHLVAEVGLEASQTRAELTRGSGARLADSRRARLRDSV